MDIASPLLRIKFIEKQQVAQIANFRMHETECVLEVAYPRRENLPSGDLVQLETKKLNQRTGDVYVKLEKAALLAGISKDTLFDLCKQGIVKAEFTETEILVLWDSLARYKKHNG